MLFSLSACGISKVGTVELEAGGTEVAETEAAEASRNTIEIIDETEASTPAIANITEEEALSCLTLSNESWLCDVFGENIETGSDVSVKFKADYYISESADAPYNVTSVFVQDVVFDGKHYLPIQTTSSVNASNLLETLGYGNSEDLVVVGEPHVVFHIECEGSGVYDEGTLSVQVPFSIVCEVTFESGEIVTVTYRDDLVSAGSGAYIELDKDSFEGF